MRYVGRTEVTRHALESDALYYEYVHVHSETSKRRWLQLKNVRVALRPLISDPAIVSRNCACRAYSPAGVLIISKEQEISRSESQSTRPLIGLAQCRMIRSACPVFHGENSFSTRSPDCESNRGGRISIFSFSRINASDKCICEIGDSQTRVSARSPSAVINLHR